MRTDLQLTPRQRLPSIVSGYTAINAVVKAELFPMAIQQGDPQRRRSQRPGRPQPGEAAADHHQVR